MNRLVDARTQIPPERDHEQNEADVGHGVMFLGCSVEAMNCAMSFLSWVADS